MLDKSGQVDIIILILACVLREHDGRYSALIVLIVLNRWQLFVINGTTSSWLPIYSGVTQGSILGPLLLDVFINDMPCLNIK